VTVSKIDEQNRIHLQDGRTLPGNYKQYTHGYAVTAHRSQGKSVDAVVILEDSMRKELFYVAASRGRESITVVTSDKELLRESITRSGIRKSASELARKGPRLPLRPTAFGQGRIVLRLENGIHRNDRDYLPEKVQTNDREKPSRGQNLEHTREASCGGRSR
jgi:hypothetical protein